MDNAQHIHPITTRVAMKQKIEELILQAVGTLKAEGIFSLDIMPTITIERTRDAQHGDFASNLALVLAKPAKTNPRQLAEKIIAALPSDDAVLKVELAGPGFINFFINIIKYFLLLILRLLIYFFNFELLGRLLQLIIEFNLVEMII